MKVNNDIKNIVKELGKRQWDEKENIFLLVESGNYSRYEICDFKYIFQQVLREEADIASRYFDDRGVMNNTLNIMMAKKAVNAFVELCDLYTDDISSVELMNIFYRYNRDILIFELNPDEKMLSKETDFKCVKVPVTSITDGLDTKEVEFYKENGKPFAKINLNGFENVAEYNVLIDNPKLKTTIDGIFAGLYSYYVDTSFTMNKTIMDESELIDAWKNQCFEIYSKLQPSNLDEMLNMNPEKLVAASNIVSSMNNILGSENISENIIQDLSSNYDITISNLELDNYESLKDFMQDNQIDLDDIENKDSLFDDCIEKGIFLDEVSVLKEADEIVQL